MGVIEERAIAVNVSQDQQVWIVDRDGSKIGATVENIFTQTVDSEVTLSTVLPA